MLKNRVIAELKNQLKLRLETYSQAIKDVQDSAQNETKSSAGDKYETARSMGQMELGMHQSQYHKVKLDLVNLEQIEKLDMKNYVSDGCLIRTDKGYYLIAISFGKLIVDGFEVFVLSANTPFAKNILMKKVGEDFEFNNIVYTIETIG